MTLPELIKALEDATGPNRELDIAIMSALCPLSEPFMLIGPMGVYTKLPQAWGSTGLCVKDNTHQVEAPKVTASVDAAIALCERVLPDWVWGISKIGHALLYEKTDSEKGYGEKIKVDHPVPAIALCLAVLRARPSQDGGGDE